MVLKVCLSVLVLLLLSFSVWSADELQITASPETGSAPLTVSFSASSLLALESVSWDFNGDGITDSSQPTATYTYNDGGTYPVSLKASSGGTEYIATKTISVKSSFVVTVVPAPSGGKAPLVVQFTSASTGKEPQTYSWDFNNDTVVDSIKQNPSYSFDLAGNYPVTLTVADADGNKVAKVVPITVTKYDSNINLTSYFPQELSVGENQITVIIYNGGTEVLKDISAKIVGSGLQHLSSSSISSLSPGDQDSLTVKVKALQSGSLSAVLKVMDKNFPLVFTVAQQVTYNKEELENQLAQMREKLKAQEVIYQDKKAAGYQVSEIYSDIKSIQGKLQETQQALLTGDYPKAKLNFDLMTTSLADLTLSLEQAKQQEVSMMQWLKENAVAITAIIAALGTIGGILVKLKSSASKVGSKVKDKTLKLSEEVKTKLKKKEESGSAASHSAESLSSSSSPTHPSAHSEEKKEGHKEEKKE